MFRLIVVIGLVVEAGTSAIMRAESKFALSYKMESLLKGSSCLAPQANQNKIFSTNLPLRGISRDQAKWARPSAHTEKSAHFNQFSQ
jgi:hypothetical protein